MGKATVVTERSWTVWAESAATKLRPHLWLLLLAVPFLAFVAAGWPVVSTGDLLGWDSGWYAGIAMDGYKFDGDYAVQQNIAFFPGMPLLVAIFKAASGLPMGHAQIAVALGLTALTCWYVFRMARAWFGEPVATMSVGLFAAHPFALYFYNGYSEPTLVAGAAALLYYTLVDPRPPFAAAAVLLASLGRPYGIFLAGIFGLWALVRSRGGRDPVATQALLVWVPLSLFGYLGFTWYCDSRFGDPLASLHATAAWAGPFKTYDLLTILSLEAPIRALQAGVTAENLADPVMVGVLCFFGGLGSYLAMAKRFPPLVALYGVALPALLYLSQLSQRTGVNNSGRYSAVYFVHAMALALLLAGRQPNEAKAERTPPLYYAVYALQLAFLIRYTRYFFAPIWVS